MQSQFPLAPFEGMQNVAELRFTESKILNCLLCEYRALKISVDVFPLEDVTALPSWCKRLSNKHLVQDSFIDASCPCGKV